MTPVSKDIAIFIDLENVYYGLKKYHMDPDHPDETHNLFLRLQEHYGRDAIRLMEAYADFEQLDLSMMSLQKKTGSHPSGVRERAKRPGTEKCGGHSVVFGCHGSVI
ncbi:MAG: hypothetical protein ACOX0J_01285 [Thermoactinomyces vulgaris]|jgi:hypothetical protein